jgi:hypothetical protein
MERVNSPWETQDCTLIFVNLRAGLAFGNRLAQGHGSPRHSDGVIEERLPRARLNGSGYEMGTVYATEIVHHR